MKRVALDVDTLRCEADEAAILDEVLSQEGVLAAEVDLAGERVSLAFDERVTSKAALLGHLRFFGLMPRTTRTS